MIKQLTKHGNSYALIIERPIMELLKIDPSTPLEISTDGDLLILSPVRDQARQASFNSALEKANRRYGKMLKQLAR